MNGPYIWSGTFPQTLPPLMMGLPLVPIVTDVYWPVSLVVVSTPVMVAAVQRTELGQ